MPISIPQGPVRVIKALRESGFEAYAVGGCVRDALLGVTPDDWDITTSATPDEVKRALAGYRIIDTGLAHGTLTVLSDDMPVEVTTYRVDGEYGDGRHPKSVTFTASLTEDLARRDFTINAMAVDEYGALIDPFGGQNDLRLRVIRAVGVPDDRLEEDALRILRALRFASRLGFGIDAETALAVYEKRGNLLLISPERISAELVGILRGKFAADIIRGFTPIISVFLPEISPGIGFDQRNRHHSWDVWEHTLRAIDAAPCDATIRLALLLHDIGKPHTFSVGEDGQGHFYGHAAISERIARAALARLRFDSKTIDTVCLLIKHHDSDMLPTEKSVKHWMNRIGVENLNMLLEVKIADNRAHAPQYGGREADLRLALDIMSETERKGACFSLRSLAVDGNDIKALGASGVTVGKVLASLLEDVIDERVQNERGALLARARRHPDILPRRDA